MAPIIRLNKKRGQIALMALILLLASATHLHAVGARSLWEDEGWTLLLSDGAGAAAIVQEMAYDQHPPLYFLIIGAWRDLGGESELALRFLSVAFSLLSVAALYQLGRQLFGPGVGVLAASLLAVWDFSIDAGQDARQYSLLVLLGILACLFYFRYWAAPTRWNGLGWFIASVAGLYTQYMLGVVLVFQLLHLLSFGGSRRLDLLIRWALICMAFLPWSGVFLRQNQVRWEDPIYYQSGLPNSAATFRLMRDALLSQQYALFAGLVLLGAVYWPPLWRTFRQGQGVLFLAGWALGYVALIIVLNEQREILRLRIFVLVLPPLLLLMARGLASLAPFPRLFLLGVLLVTQLGTVDTRQDNPPWRAVVQQVAQWHQPGDPVLMDIWVGDFSARYYVVKQMGPITPWLSIRELRSEARAMFLPELLGYLADHPGFWLLRWNDDPTDYEPLLAQQGYQRSASPYINHAGNRLYAHRYDRRPETRWPSSAHPWN
ncbi:MAG: hypothetical protein HC915_10035 [Anaerolineae bacterium]|nr:hypothetical protein [Anaerolineae bacterium]